MKTPTIIILLAASLAGNFYLWLERGSEHAAAPEQLLGRQGAVSHAEPAGEALLSRDFATQAAELRAAGLPEPLVRAAIAAEVDEQFRSREEALRPKRQLKFWEADFAPLPLETTLALLDLAREKKAARQRLLGPDPVSEREQLLYSHVPAEKRDQLKLITEDYTTMVETLRLQAGKLPTDAELRQLKVVEEEYTRDLAELLDADAIAEHQRRFSSFADAVRRQLQYFEMTPDDYLKVWPVVEGRASATSTLPGTLTQAAQSQSQQGAQLEARLKEALGAQRYDDYQLARNYDYTRLADLAARAGLPTSASRDVFVIRNTMADACARIAADSTLGIEEKRQALRQLAADTRAKVLAVLGPDAFAAAQRMSDRWFAPLEKGQVVQFRQNGMSSSPVESRRASPPAPSINSTR